MNGNGEKRQFLFSSGRTLQEVFRKHHPEGVSEMVELPQGDVLEVRRGGPETLRMLSSDMTRLSSTGYIRIERRPMEQMPRVGHVVFREGKPMMALHEVDAITMGLEALLDIESDGILSDALLAIHEIPLAEIDRVLSLYLDAHLLITESSPRANDKHQWWSKSRLRTSSWSRNERLPELETIVEAPEIIRLRSKAMLNRHEGFEKMLRPGDAYLLDSTDPSGVFDLAGHLAVHGRPLLVLARHDIEALNVRHNIPIASSSWLSENGEPRSTSPNLDEIRRKIDAFLWENLRAVVVLEGIEYLSSIHGDERIVNFLRDIVDGVRLEDHLFVVTADFNAFSLTTRQHLSRYMSELESTTLEYWNLEPDMLLDHPLCAPASEEERKWIEQQLEQAISSTQGGFISPQSTVFGTMIGGVEQPGPEEIHDATESLENVAREWVHDEHITQVDERTEIDKVPKMDTFDSPHELISELQTPIKTPPLKGAGEIEPTASEPTLHGDEDTVQIAETIQTTIPLPVPRTAQRIRRKVRKATRPTSKHRRASMAAAAKNARNPKEFLEIVKRTTEPPNAISHSLENFARRQDAALSKISTQKKTNTVIRDAVRQRVNRKEHVLPITQIPEHSLSAIKGKQSLDTQTNLTPLNARPGITKNIETQKMARESASRKQTQSSIEDKLSIWEKEDRERLRTETGVAGSE